MTDEEILQVDFYDLCGCGALWMTDEDKIKYWREFVEMEIKTKALQSVKHIKATPEFMNDKNKVDLLKQIVEKAYKTK